MFHGLLRRTLINKCSTGAVSQFTRFESIIPARSRAKEIQDVKLIGTIYQEPLTLKDGAKLLTIKTNKPDNHYKVHRAVIRSPKILSLVGNSLTVGQRVFVSGDLRANTYVNNENQNRQSFHVHVNEIYASKPSDSGVNTDEDSNRPIDHNSVFVLAHIASDIQHADNFSRFFVATHHTSKNLPDGEAEKTSFLNIYVHDDDLIKITKENLQKRDRVFISGILSSKADTDQNGQRKYSGHIEATNILKVDRFSEAKNENIIEENVQ